MRKSTGTDPLFCTERGRPLTKNSLALLFRRLRTRAGMDEIPISPKIFRHSLPCAIFRQEETPRGYRNCWRMREWLRSGSISASMIRCSTTRCKKGQKKIDGALLKERGTSSFSRALGRGHFHADENLGREYIACLRRSSSCRCLGHVFAARLKTMDALETGLHGQRRTEQKKGWKDAYLDLISPLEVRCSTLKERTAKEKSEITVRICVSSWSRVESATPRMSSS